MVFRLTTQLFNSSPTLFVNSFFADFLPEPEFIQFVSIATCSYIRFCCKYLLFIALVNPLHPFKAVRSHRNLRLSKDCKTSFLVFFCKFLSSRIISVILLCSDSRTGAPKQYSIIQVKCSIHFKNDFCASVTNTSKN